MEVKQVSTLDGHVSFDSLKWTYSSNIPEREMKGSHQILT